MGSVRRNDLMNNIITGYNAGMQFQRDQRAWDDQQKQDKAQGILYDVLDEHYSGPYGNQAMVEREDYTPPKAAIPEVESVAPQAPPAMPTGVPGAAPSAPAVPASAVGTTTPKQPAVGGTQAPAGMPDNPMDTKQVADDLGAAEEAREGGPGTVLSQFRATKATDWKLISQMAYARTMKETGDPRLAQQSVAYIETQMRTGFVMGLNRAQLALDSNQYDRAAEELTRAWTYFPNGMGSAVFVVREDDGTIGLYGVPMDEDGEKFDDGDKLFKIDQTDLDQYIRSAGDPMGEAQHRRARGEGLEDARLASAAKNREFRMTREERGKAGKAFRDEFGDEYSEIVRSILDEALVNVEEEDRPRLRHELRTIAIKRYMIGYEDQSQYISAHAALQEAIDMWRADAEKSGPPEGG